MIKKATGYLILLSFFGGIFALGVSAIGFVPTLIIFAGVISLTALVAFGLWLITSGDDKEANEG
tara:strand:- start:253 stop:444 length:192 start_codon:yes stop_codon:yes gene_type:complete